MSTASDQIRRGHLVGAGAAVNVALGFIPARVDIWNITDGSIVTVGFLSKMIGFTSGGTAVPKAGQTITGITSGAKAKLKDVIVVSGSFAGGDAAGFLVADADEITGTFGTENVTLSDSPATQDDASVVAPVEHSIKIDTAAASVTGNNAISSYVGAAGSAAKGFTIGSGIAASGKLLRWEARR